jgi:nicotinamidase-related amidase
MRAVVAFSAVFYFAVVAYADTAIDQWAAIKAPAPPPLKDVTVDPASTALLLLDFNGAQDPSKGPCNTNNKPRCIASLPVVKSLRDAAKASKTYVVYSVGGSGEAADIATAIAPQKGDPVVKSGPDKFINTKLGDLLKAKGIKTVIVTGTAAEGAVLATAEDAALHGINVIIPVDGMSSTDIYAEQYVTWHFSNAPGVAMKTTLTTAKQIKF